MGDDMAWPGRNPRRWVQEIISGTVTAFVIVSLSGSYGLLIFGDRLAPYAGFGITMSLITAILVGGYLALRSGYFGLIAIPQDRIAPILAFLASTIVVGMQDRPTEEVLGTVVAGIALTSILTGALLFSLGQLKLGNLIRFIPYPVVGGFLAGSGWLLCAGSLNAMTGLPPSITGLLRGFHDGSILLWLPCAAFGLGIFYLSLKLKHWSVLPGSIIAGSLLFYLWLGVAGGGSIELARHHSWLPGGLGVQAPFDFIPLKMVIYADPWVLLAQGGTFAAVAVISLVSILLNSSALELDTNQEADLNDELRHTGLGNALAGLGGGLVGFTSLSLTRLGREMGGHTRLAGLVTALACATCFAVGTDLISFIPRFILGGLLFYLGLRFLHEWVVQAWFRLPKTDYAAVMLILVVIGTAGYLEGVTVGLIAASVLFVVNYSQVRVVAGTLHGDQQRSSVDRSAPEDKFLRQEGKKTLILKLQGYVFFGSANNILVALRSRNEAPESPPLQFAILDFRGVHGLDSSAVLALRKMQLAAQARSFSMIFCHLGPGIKKQLQNAGLPLEATPSFRVIRDLDHALEWCEDSLLDHFTMRRTETPPSLEEQMRPSWPDSAPPFSRLVAFLDRMECQAGDVLVDQGEDANELFFIHRGRVSARLKLQNGKWIRLRSMRQGTVVGELGLFLDEPRNASIVVEEPCVAYRLTRQNLLRMEQEAPEVAAAFHHFMIRLLADRVVVTTRNLQSSLE
jgi:SulP family sulfate permease